MPSAEFVERLFEAYAGIDRPWTCGRVMDLRRFEGLIEYSDVEDMARRRTVIKNQIKCPRHYQFRSARQGPRPTASPVFP